MKLNVSSHLASPLKEIQNVKTKSLPSRPNTILNLPQPNRAIRKATAPKQIEAHTSLQSPITSDQ
jgi:hypothetical protein